MKTILRVLFIGLCGLCMSGCSSNDSNMKMITTENSVESVINSQITSEEQTTTETTTEDITETEITESEIMEENNITTEANVTESGELYETVDYDLTDMSSDMVYATVYQMMVYPEQYVGKTLRIEGSFYATYYEPRQKYYFYCIIADATACCMQGMEFVWDDGSHIYPDEYPADNTEVVIEGTFETYKDEGDVGLYCRLSNASLKLK